MAYEDTIEYKRKYLGKLYGPSWAARVNKMSDAQVSAVYLRHINKNEEKK